MGLGAISGVTTWRPPLPPYSLDNGVHYILGRFKVGLGWLVNAYSNYSIHKGEGGFKPRKPTGSTKGNKEVSFKYPREQFHN